MPSTSCGEWAFEQQSTNGGRLTYRCISLNISTDADDFTEADLQLIADIVQTMGIAADPADALEGNEPD